MTMHLQNVIKLHQLIHKILSILNKISKYIKGHNSVDNERQIILVDHPNLHLVNINTYTKFNPQINLQDIEHKQNYDVNQDPLKIDQNFSHDVH